MYVLDTIACRQQFDVLAARMIAKPESPYGMPGVALFARDGHGNSTNIYLGSDERGTPLTPDSTVCLASTGKLAIALLVLRLVDQKRIVLTDAVRELVDVEYGEVGQAKVGDLLSHRADVPCILSGDVLDYGRTLTAERLRAHWRHLSRGGRGKYVRYSDVAYGLLADVVEGVMGRPLHECLASVNELIGTRLTLGIPRDPDFIRVSGLPGKHTEESIRPFNSRYWYGLAAPWGAISGAPDDAVRLLRAFAAGSPALSAELQHIAVRDPDSGELPGELPGAENHMGVGPYATIEWERCSWGLGVEIQGSKFPHWSPREASSDSFGHGGASGILVWHDPATAVTWGITGTRTSYTGWLFRYGPLVGKAVLHSLAKTH